MLRVSSGQRLNHVITFRKSRRVNITTLNLITYTALSYLMSTCVCTSKNQWRLVQFWLTRDFYTPRRFIKGYCQLFGCSSIFGTSFSNNFSWFQLETNKTVLIYKLCWPYMVSIQKKVIGKKTYKKSAILNHFVTL